MPRRGPLEGVELCDPLSELLHSRLSTTGCFETHDYRQGSGRVSQRERKEKKKKGGKKLTQLN